MNNHHKKTDILCQCAFCGYTNIYNDPNDWPMDKWFDIIAISKQNEYRAKYNPDRSRYYYLRGALVICTRCSDSGKIRDNLAPDLLAEIGNWNTNSNGGLTLPPRFFDGR